MKDRDEAVAVMVPEPAVVSQDVMASIRKPKELNPEALRTRKYRVATKEDCPRQNYTLAGICFPRYIERMEEQGGETVRSREFGCIVELTDSQVEEIKLAVAKRVVREGGGRRDVLEIGSTGFFPDPSDKPLAGYLSMVPVTEDQLVLQAPPK